MDIVKMCEALDIEEKRKLAYFMTVLNIKIYESSDGIRINLDTLPIETLDALRNFIRGLVKHIRL